MGEEVRKLLALLPKACLLESNNNNEDVNKNDDNNKP